MNDYIQVEQEDDGRWIARFATFDSITFEGATKEEAVAEAEEALRIVISLIQEVT